MACYHQMGHDSKNLLDEVSLSAYGGAVLSPVNYSEASLSQQVATYQNEKFETIFDPQLYFPKSNRGELSKWAYYPSDVETADPTSRKWWTQVVKNLARTVREIGVHSVCSPAIAPRVFAPEYYALALSVASELKEVLTPQTNDVLLTLIVGLRELASKEKCLEIASVVTGGDLSRVYLVLVADLEPRRELFEDDDLAGGIQL